ncbi:MAG TPA: glycosyltransferase family 39 protein, partial [Anaerolineae bacterium]
MLIVLLAFGLRVYRLGAQAIWWDESLSLYRATRDLSTILANTILIQNVVTHDLQPPLYFVLLHFFVSVSGVSEFALRFLSVMANVATVPVLFALARRWFSPSVGILAAFLGALSPFYVWYAQEARPYALVLFLALLAIYAVARAFKGHEGRPVDLGWLAVYACASIASLYTNYYALFLIPFHVVLIALTVWRTARMRPFILLPALPLASAIFLLPLASAGATENAAGGPVYVPFGVILRDLLNSFSVGITIDLAQIFWIDLALLALCLIGLIAFRRASVFLFAFLAIPLLGLAVACLVRPLYQHSRYLIALSPAFYLGVAAGIVALAQRWRVMAAPALGVFLIGAVLSLNNLYFEPSYGKDDHRAWADYLRGRARPGDFLILDSPHTEALYRYYANDTVPMTTLPILRADHVDSPEQDLAAVHDAYAHNARVWFLAMDV